MLRLSFLIVSYEIETFWDFLYLSQILYKTKILNGDFTCICWLLNSNSRIAFLFFFFLNLIFLNCHFSTRILIIYQCTSIFFLLRQLSALNSKFWKFDLPCNAHSCIFHKWKQGYLPHPSKLWSFSLYILYIIWHRVHQQ